MLSGLRVSALTWLVEIGRYLAASPQSRWRQRTAFLELDDRLLRDIGITPNEAALAGRPRLDDRPISAPGLPSAGGLARSERYW
jgi:uncharacterized protein YjiS (DUF1127 family)